MSRFVVLCNVMFCLVVIRSVVKLRLGGGGLFCLEHKNIDRYIYMFQTFTGTRCGERERERERGKLANKLCVLIQASLYI